MDFLRTRLTKIPITKKLNRKIPESPGIYIFWAEDSIIYIGKAINLRRRVSSYFDIGLMPKTAKMVHGANQLSFIRAESEIEALLLEARLIRKYMPRYNIAAKDDKHPLYIRITKERYPRVVTARKDAEKLSNIALFGPFPSSTSVHSVLKLLRRIFPYSDHKLSSRGCLYSHIGLCNPCPNEIKTPEQRNIYLKNIGRVKAVLSGKFQGVKEDLLKEMKVYSNAQRFEEAKVVRERIEKLDYITRPQMPTESYIQNPNLYEDIRKGEMSDLLKILVDYKLKIDNCTRIECFDIAHLAGTNPTASMVTFVAGEPDKSFYRHFRIRQKKGNSDVDSMKEVIKRRIQHIGDWGKPGLIIVDGGRSQANAFTSILHSNEVDIPVIGIAKNPDRLIVGEEKIKLSGPALNLVQRIRDEAHRFARRYHHALISKEITHADDY